MLVAVVGTEAAGALPEQVPMVGREQELGELRSFVVVAPPQFQKGHHRRKLRRAEEQLLVVEFESVLEPVVAEELQRDQKRPKPFQKRCHQQRHFPVPIVTAPVGRPEPWLVAAVVALDKAAAAEGLRIQHKDSIAERKLPIGSVDIAAAAAQGMVVAVETHSY